MKKELREWVIILTVGGFIYFMGWHTSAISKIQEVVLLSGAIQPNQTDELKKASYEFTLEDVNGNLIPFSSFKNRVVFLNFWATWCPPCLAEMPDINRLFDSQKDSTSFVMISVDKDETKATEFIQEKQYEFPIYFLRSSLPSTYDAHSIPTTYVIDMKGTIKVEHHGMAKYNTEKFKALLQSLNTTSI